MSAAPPQKFDEGAFRREMDDYIRYLKCAWKIAVATAEECIAPPRQPDDAEASDLRRGIIYDLSIVIFGKMTLDPRDTLALAFWTQAKGRRKRPKPRRKSV